MIRILIVIVFYSLVAFRLPSWPPFGELLLNLARLPSHTAFAINIGALIGSAGLLYILMRKPNGLIYRHPSGLLEICRTGLIGIIFATLYALFEAMSGFAITVTNLALIPLAFVAGETAFVMSRWMWLKLTGRQKPAPHAAPLQDETLDHSRKSIPRLLVTMPVYVLVLVYLPQQQDFRNLEAKLVNISPSIAFGVSIAAIIIAAIVSLLYLNRTKKQKPILTGDNDMDAKTIHIAQIKLSLVLSFAIGLGIAALMNIVGYFASYAPSMVFLIIMPVGFTVAEAVYEGLNWRVKYGPADV